MTEQTKAVNSFFAYELSDEQTIRGSIYSVEQMQVLQNHLAVYAEQKVALKYDADNHSSFLQKEAELTAQIELIQFLMDSSESALESLQNPNSDEEFSI